MPDIERTSAVFQAVIPGCERRTLPKSTTSSDDTGQGLLDFYRPSTLREKLVALSGAPLQSAPSSSEPACAWRIDVDLNQCSKWCRFTQPIPIFWLLGWASIKTIRWVKADFINWSL